MPWRRALLRWMPVGMRLTQVYETLGWTRGARRHYFRQTNLRLTTLVAMADAVRAPRASFLRTVLREMVLLRALPTPLPTLRKRPRRGIVGRRLERVSGRPLKEV